MYVNTASDGCVHTFLFILFKISSIYYYDEALSIPDNVSIRKPIMFNLKYILPRAGFCATAILLGALLGSSIVEASCDTDEYISTQVGETRWRDSNELYEQVSSLFTPALPLTKEYDFMENVFVERMASQGYIGINPKLDQPHTRYRGLFRTFDRDDNYVGSVYGTFFVAPDGSLLGQEIVTFSTPESFHERSDQSFHYPLKLEDESRYIPCDSFLQTYQNRADRELLIYSVYMTVFNEDYSI